MKFSTNSFGVGNYPRRNVLVPCDHGLMIVNRFDSNEQKSGQSQWILDHGNVGTVEANCTFELVQSETPIIIDVGANIGTYATWVSKGYPKGKIYCFEPQRIVFQMLCGNMAINNIDNVYAYNCALSHKEGLIEFAEPDYSTLNNFGSFSLIKQSVTVTQDKYSVDVFTLDNFVKKHRLDRVDFIKIDCEGMDLAVLQGAEQIIKTCHPGIIIEYKTDWSDHSAEILNILSKYNYEYRLEDRNIIAR